MTVDHLGKISGTVVPFRGMGRKLGYPTANLKVDTKIEDTYTRPGGQRLLRPGTGAGSSPLSPRLFGFQKFR
jgi:hypothetical protein